MLGDDVMALYGFAQGLIQEAGIRIKQLMEQNLTIETKSNPNDLVTNVDKATSILPKVRYGLLTQ